MDHSPGHHLSPVSGIPGWKRTLREEGLNQQAPWGGQAPGLWPTFEKLRFRVIQNTSGPAGQRAGLGLLGLTQRPLLPTEPRPSSRSALSASGFPPWRLSCRSGDVCSSPSRHLPRRGSFCTEASSWGSRGRAAWSPRSLSLTPARSGPLLFLCWVLLPWQLLWNSLQGEKMASFYPD